MRFERPFNSVQPPVQPQRDLVSTLFPQLAFPDNRHSPSGFDQMMLIAPVPAHVGMELGLPEFPASGGDGGVRAPDVTMPEAAVNKAHRSESTKHHIGGAREIAVVQTIPQTACVESPAKNEFGYSVPASNPRHHAGTGRLVHYVRHLCFLTDSGKYLHRRISRKVLGMIKSEHTPSTGPGDAACVDSVPGVHVGLQVRGPHSRLEHSIRILAADGEHVFRLQSQLGCNR